MKYLKSFNEELKPDIYRKAGRSLDYYNKRKRASSLIDYADEKEFGFYKIHFANTNVIVTKSDGQTFTNPSLIGIYVGGVSDEFNLLSFKNKGKEESMINSLVNSWKNGSKSLAINFEFGVKATRETLDNNPFKHFNKPERPNNAEYKYYSSHIPLFSLDLEFSEWYDGIEEYDSEAKWESERRGEEFEPTNIYQFFEWTKSFNLVINKPYSDYFGIFADRKSAQKFKNWLLTIVDDKIKDVIMELLSIVSGSSEDIEAALKKFKNIRVMVFMMMRVNL